MSLVSSGLALKHLCTIERNVAAAAGYGDPATPNWQPNLVDQPCFSWASTGNERVTDQTTVTVVEDMRLILQLGVDVAEGDRVASISYRGDTIQDGPISIRAILRHQDHIELVLTRIA